jgi:hypothetical protein
MIGCGPAPEIRSYTVPRLGKQPQRLLGAIIPHGEQIWFVKATGPADSMARELTRFDEFLAQLTFSDKGELQYSPPAGWVQIPNRDKMRKATFRLGDDPAPELLVTSLENTQQAGQLLGNINRWRGQIGLPDLDAAALTSVTQSRIIAGQAATRVDMTAAAEASSPTPPAAPVLPFTHKLPDGWRVAEQPVTFATLTLTGRDPAVQITVSELKGDGGGLPANVTRWRGQVGLPDGPPETTPLTVSGQAGQWLDLASPEAANPRQRLLIAWVPHAGQTWVVRMRGPHAAVTAHLDAFKEFLASFQFTGGR